MDTKSRLNKYSESVIDTESALELLYRKKRISLAVISDLEEIEKYNSNFESIFYKSASLATETDSVSVAEYHDTLSSIWLIPEYYADLDIEKYILDKCTTTQETDRVQLELALFREFGLYNLLKLMVYIVDTLRQKNVTYGVGRGSSVASYCLFLIGIHRIDSLKYNLDITEFLK